jgi:hypothetical protein
MKLRRIIIAAACAAALIVAAGVVVSFLPTKSGHSVAQTVFGGAGTPSPPAGTSNSRPDAPTSPGEKARSGSKASKQDDSLINGVGKGLEQIPTATPTPYRLHPTAPPKTIRADDVAVAPHSKVKSKSISTAEGTTQVLISATTTSKTADTLAYYQRVFTSLGMRGKPVPAVGGSTAIAFSKGKNTITLTVSSRSGGSSYLIHGVLRTGA